MLYRPNVAMPQLRRRDLTVAMSVGTRLSDGAPVARIDRSERDGENSETYGVWLLPNGFTHDTIVEIETMATSIFEQWVEHRYGVQALLL